MKNLPVRKPNRFKNYDYCQNGASYITICTKNRAELFCTINLVGAASCRPSKKNRPIPSPNFRPYIHYHLQLNKIGQIVKDEIMTLSTTYTNVMVDKYVIMPDHIHIILVIDDDGKTGNDVAPTISQIMNQWKRAISIKIGFSPWQKSFYDHIIRDWEDYYRIVEYIENNPARWIHDRYYKIHRKNSGSPP